MRRKYSFLLLLVAIILSSCSEPAELSEITGVWAPTEKFYERLENEGAAEGHLSGPVRVVFHIDLVGEEYLLTRRIEGTAQGLQDYRIIERKDGFVAEPIESGPKPEMPLKILGPNKIEFTHPNDGKMPMMRASTAHNKPE